MAVKHIDSDRDRMEKRQRDRGTNGEGIAHLYTNVGLLFSNNSKNGIGASGTEDEWL